MRGTVNYCKELLYTDKDNERAKEITEWIKNEENKKAVITIGVGMTFFDLISNLTCDKDRVYIVLSSAQNKRAAGFVFFGQNGIPLFYGSLGGVMSKKVHTLEDIAFSIGERQTWCVGEVFGGEFSEKEENFVKTLEIESFMRAFLLFSYI